MSSTHAPSVALLAFLAVALGAMASGCMDRRAATDSQSLQVSAASPAAVRVTGGLPQDVQLLFVTVINGEFQHDVYDAQTNPTRLIVTTVGGPYTFSIDTLMQPVSLPADILAARVPPDSYAVDGVTAPSQDWSSPPPKPGGLPWTWLIDDVARSQREVPRWLASSTGETCETTRPPSVTWPPAFLHLRHCALTAPL